MCNKVPLILKWFYLPEVLHVGEAPECSGVPRRQRRVKEKLRHDFGVIVHVGVHHPIRHCRQKKGNDGTRTG